MNNSDIDITGKNWKAGLNGFSVNEVDGLAYKDIQNKNGELCGRLIVRFDKGTKFEDLDFYEKFNDETVNKIVTFVETLNWQEKTKKSGEGEGAHKLKNVSFTIDTGGKISIFKNYEGKESKKISEDHYKDKTKDKFQKRHETMAEVFKIFEKKEKKKV